MGTITVHAQFNKAILQEIAINKLHGGTYQPRDSFALEGLESLAKTIEQVGVLEPLVVRVSPRDANKYEVVAGERRLRAAKLAGLEVVPCLLANYSNEQAAQIALIENTCREALNPIVEAFAMHRLTVEFGYTHEEIAFLLGMSRATVTNLLRLLNLDARIQHWMKQGILSEAHGKILAVGILKREVKVNDDEASDLRNEIRGIDAGQGAGADAGREDADAGGGAFRGDGSNASGVGGGWYF